MSILKTILIIVPAISFGCIPTLPPDDMLEITTTTALTTTSLTTTTSSTTTTTSFDNTMCQYCPTPFNCATIPTGAVDCNPAPGGMAPMVMRGVNECTLTDVTCDFGEVIFALEEDNTWTNTGFTQYLNGACSDANPQWICDGRPVQRIVCATPM